MDVLILTNTMDGTSDVLVKLLKKKKNINLVRWNVDYWFKYEISFRDNNFYISEPEGKIVSSENKVKVLWRKPFTDYVDLNRQRFKYKEDDLSFIKSQIKTIISTIISYARDYGKVFIDPVNEYHLTKLRQLKLANKYFQILPYEFSVLKINKNIADTVTKPLGDSRVGKEILYTTQLKQKNASRPFPWFFQKGIFEGSDVTCVYIKGEAFFYICKFRA